MDTEAMILVSIDDHVIEPPDMFERHVPERWRADAPRVERSSDGTDAWTFQGVETTPVWSRAPSRSCSVSRRYISFGHGAHFCLGASSARLESRVALEGTLTRFPSWEIDESRLEMVHTSSVRGFQSVPVSVL
jgi:cytochrome P450